MEGKKNNNFLMAVIICLVLVIGLGIGFFVGTNNNGKDENGKGNNKVTNVEFNQSKLDYAAKSLGIAVDSQYNEFGRGNGIFFDKIASIFNNNEEKISKSDLSNKAKVGMAISSLSDEIADSNRHQITGDKLYYSLNVLPKEWARDYLSDYDKSKSIIFYYYTETEIKDAYEKIFGVGSYQTTAYVEVCNTYIYVEGGTISGINESIYLTYDFGCGDAPGFILNSSNTKSYLKDEKIYLEQDIKYNDVVDVTNNKSASIRYTFSVDINGNYIFESLEKIK